MLEMFEGFTMPAYLISYDCDGEPIALRVPHESAERRTVGALKRIGCHIDIGDHPADRLSETSASSVKSAPSGGHLL
jgi:hypothetical protein